MVSNHIFAECKSTTIETVTTGETTNTGEDSAAEEKPHAIETINNSNNMIARTRKLTRGARFRPNKLTTLTTNAVQNLREGVQNTKEQVSSTISTTISNITPPRFKNNNNNSNNKNRVFGGGQFHSKKSSSSSDLTSFICPIFDLVVGTSLTDLCELLGDGDLSLGVLFLLFFGFFTSSSGGLLDGISSKAPEYIVTKTSFPETVTPTYSPQI